MKTGFRKVLFFLTVALACGLIVVGGRSLLLTRLAEPKMDAPEATVRSLYAMKEPVAKASKDLLKRYLEVFLSERYLEEVKGKEELADLDSDMRIESAELETRSRAVVMCSYLPSFTEETGRETLKFVLMKEGNKWKVDGIFAPCPICKGTGRNRDFAEEIGEPPSTVECELCEGTGWEKSWISEMW